MKAWCLRQDPELVGRRAIRRLKASAADEERPPAFPRCCKLLALLDNFAVKPPSCIVAMMAFVSKVMPILSRDFVAE